MAEFRMTYGEDAKFNNSIPIHASNTVLEKFSSKVILALCLTTLSNINLPDVTADFILEAPTTSLATNDIAIPESLTSYLNSQKNRDYIEESLSKIQSYPESWWDKYEAYKPDISTFLNVRKFLDMNFDDALLNGTEVMPKRNATILLEWSSKLFMCSLNIGVNEFSYSILPNGSEPLIGQSSIENKEDIKLFFHRLTSVMNV